MLDAAHLGQTQQNLAKMQCVLGKC